MKRAHKRLLTALIAGLLVSAGIVWMWQSRPGYEVVPGFQTVAGAFAKKQSRVMAEVQGRVVRVLANEREDGSTQKFVIQLGNGQNLLVVHDLDRADRVPLSIADLVTVRGEYDWSETGGTMQLTRRDSSWARRHGWIEHQGKRYD